MTVCYSIVSRDEVKYLPKNPKPKEEYLKSYPKLYLRVTIRYLNDNTPRIVTQTRPKLDPTQLEPDICYPTSSLLLTGNSTHKYMHKIEHAIEMYIAMYISMAAMQCTCQLLPKNWITFENSQYELKYKLITNYLNWF